MTPNEKIDEWFKYHVPSAADRASYQALRDTARDLAQLIVAVTPVCADQTAALRKLRECLMTANSAIACKGA